MRGPRQTGQANVSDEYQLQVTRRDDESSLVLSSAQSSLVARGRRDAALLTLSARAESEEGRSGLLGWPALWDQIEKPTEEVQREAEQGYAPAQFNLGWRYDNRHLGVPGVGQDYAEAAKWYHRAAEQGFCKAQFNLGLKYVYGHGVAQDYVQGYMWMELAAPKANVADGKRYAATRDRVAANMSPAQIAEAQRLALTWVTDRRDESIAKEGNLAEGCNKCGERNELVFAGCVCASCSEALDRQWGGSTATDWLVTRPDNSVGSRVLDLVLLNTTYAQMKKYSWAANDSDSRIQGFFRFRQATSEEIAHFESQPGIWSHASGSRVVRPATHEEVAAQKQRHREWQIAMDTDQIIREACEELGIQMNEHDVPVEDPQRIEQAADGIAGRLRQLGWLEELAKMKREDSDALHAMDGPPLLEMALQRSRRDTR